MKLTRAEADTLVLAVFEAIQSGFMSKFGFIVLHDVTDWESKTLSSLDEKTAATLRRNLDDGGLSGFVRAELLLMFLEADESLPSATRQKLNLYDVFSDALQVAKGLVDKIRSLPAQYRLVTRASIPLSEGAKRTDVNLKISDRLWLVSGSELPDSFKLTHPLERIDEHARRGINEDRNLQIVPDQLYFEYRNSGYVSDRYNGKLVREFSDDLRAFYGAAVATQILFEFSFTFEEAPTLIAINKLEEEDGDVLIHFDNLEGDLVKSTYFDTRGTTDKRLKAESLEEVLQPILDMFGSAESAKLCTAAIWFLRAHLSPREMDKILESTIAVEVLLGDRDTSDRIGLSRLMANRCAYSLGRTAAERKGIIDFFSAFYKVRSEIVHSGRFKITDEEKRVVQHGLDLAARILRHEIQLAADL